MGLQKDIDYNALRVWKPAGLRSAASEFTHMASNLVSGGNQLMSATGLESGRAAQGQHDQALAHQKSMHDLATKFQAAASALNTGAEMIESLQATVFPLVDQANSVANIYPGFMMWPDGVPNVPDAPTGLTVDPTEQAKYQEAHDQIMAISAKVKAGLQQMVDIDASVKAALTSAIGAEKNRSFGNTLKDFGLTLAHNSAQSWSQLYTTQRDIQTFASTTMVGFQDMGLVGWSLVRDPKHIPQNLNNLAVGAIVMGHDMITNDDDFWGSLRNQNGQTGEMFTAQVLGELTDAYVTGSIGGAVKTVAIKPALEGAKAGYAERALAAERGLTGTAKSQAIKAAAVKAAEDKIKGYIEDPKRILVDAWTTSSFKITSLKAIPSVVITELGLDPSDLETDAQTLGASINESVLKPVEQLLGPTIQSLKEKSIKPIAEAPVD